MTISSDQQAKLNDLLNKGDIAGATSLLTQINEKAQADAANPPPPREPGEIIVDVLDKIHGLLGNHPALDGLMKELHERVAPAKEPEKPAK